MSVEASILCGPSAGRALPGVGRNPLHLRLWRPQPNVFLALEDVSRVLWTDVPDVFLDLLDVAAYVYAADQAVKRGGDTDRNWGEDWRRLLHFAVPVRRPDLWNTPAVRDALVDTLSFLSEDQYDFRFDPHLDPEKAPSYLQFGRGRFADPIRDVLLFSGGLDSLAGAVQEAVADRTTVILVQHRSNPKVAGVHRRLLSALAGKAAAAPPVHLPVRVHKAKGLTREFTQRARSFLFAALGAAVAAVLGLDRVRFYENGVVSANLPLCTQVVGARASRTTHPRVLDGLTRLFTALAGRPFTVDNPFGDRTKEQVVRLLAEHGCAELIRHTRSCARPRAATNRQPHCGVCSQCLGRRLAVLDAGLEGHDPADTYRVDVLRGEIPEGRDQTMVAVYAETARRLAGAEPTRFFGTYGEVTRLLDPEARTATGAAHAIFDLHQRHARAVTGVLERALGEQAARGLWEPPGAGCLLRMITGARAGGPEAPADSPLGENVFRNRGEAWLVRFAGHEEFILMPSVGAAYLSLLLQSPGRPIRATRLVALVAGSPQEYAMGDAGPSLDPDARAALRAECEDYREQIDRARRAEDDVLLGQLQSELAALAERLTRARGLGGRDRRDSDDRENCRKAVVNGIRRAVDKIRKYDRTLAEHLQPPVLRVGVECCYQPPEGVRWEA
jgi:7-cyano-7-deazaguanine synthase in queuosine biosynthesis